MAEQLNLFRNTQKLLDDVKVSDELQLWSFIAGDTILNDCLDNLLGSGLLNSDEEALDFLDNFVSKKLIDFDISYRQDVARSGRAKRKVPGVLYGKGTVQQPLELRLGSLSHALILNLLEGSFPGLASEQLDLSFPAKRLDLFSTNCLNLCSVEPIFWNKGQSHFYFSGLKPSEQAREIEDLVGEMGQLASLPVWSGYYRKSQSLLRWLKASLIPLVGNNFIESLFTPQTGEMYEEYLMFLTALIWGRAVADAIRSKEIGESPKIIFKEVDILSSYDFGMHGGRADGFEVLISEEHRQKLSTLKGLTAGQLLKSAFDLFGDNFSIKPIDLKISVGDFGTGKAMEEYKASEPLLRHRQQLEQYIFLTTFSWYLSLCGHKGYVLAKDEDIWDICSKVYEGNLLYYFPEGQREFEVLLPSDEQRDLFVKRLVFKWRQAEISAKLRIVDSAVANCLGRVRTAKKIVKTTPPKQKEKNLEAKQLFFEILDRYRHFVDVEKKLEIVGETKKGDPIFLLRLRKEEIPENGFISCPFPDHLDVNPSTHLWPNGRFYCFSCGRGGFYEVDDNNINVNGSSIWQLGVQRSNLKKTQSLVIPERHHEVLSLVQQNLQKGFRRSPAEKYLEAKRNINPELAFQYGAGYADTNIVFNLLSAGLTFKELVHFGLVGFSSNASPTSIFVRQLLKIARENELKIEKKGLKGETVVSWPYDVLAGRVTFPLMLGGKITNLYTRDILGRSKRLANRKLSVEYTKIPHGGFNSQILSDSSVQEIIVTEAVIDDLTLKQLGWSDSMAMIGLNNAVLLENLLASGKEVIWALDFDEAGRKQTEKMIERCKKAGVKSSDFTSIFFGRYPSAKNYDDYNSWWQREGYKRKK
ncbi:MAG: toprim domain-containing protein [Candidatus Pacebacteria bacterium]|nr:toprim domain-containing protein [Candidatus Paceibacterota bacterium]